MGSYSYSKVILLGNLTRDPELRYTPGGLAVASFALAINHRYRASGGGEESAPHGEGDKSKDYKEEVSFIDCVAWNKTAEFISGNFVKGQGIFVSGRLQQRRWEKDGAKMSKLEIVVEDAQFTTPKKEKMDVATLDDGPVQDEEVPF